MALQFALWQFSAVFAHQIGQRKQANVHASGPRIAEEAIDGAPGWRFPRLGELHRAHMLTRYCAQVFNFGIAQMEPWSARRKHVRSVNFMFIKMDASLFIHTARSRL